MIEPLTMLRPLIVSGRIVDDPEILDSYEVPERGEKGRAAFLVEPGDTRELSATAAWAYANRARLVIQGANSGLVGASIPDTSGSQGILGLRRMNRIIDFVPGERAVVVEAGVTLDDLNRIVGEEGLFFPVELGSNPTIGGLVATNAGGARTIRHGDVSKNVLGVEAVIADQAGSTIGQTTTLVKDNSRLKAGRLFVGSYGSLGVISRIALRLAVRPSRVATAMLAFASEHDVLSCLFELEKRLGSALSAFEMIGGEAIGFAFDNVSGLRRPFPSMDHGCYVLVEAITHGGDDIEETLAWALDGVHPVDAVIAPPSDLWQIRHSLSRTVRSTGTTLRFDIAVPRSALPLVQEKVEAVVQDASPRPTVSQYGHWGDGGIHLHLVYDDDLAVADARDVSDRVYEVVVRDLGGSFSAEHGLGPQNATYYRRYVPEGEREMERRIKEMFDPHGVWGREPFSPDS